MPKQISLVHSFGNSRPFIAIRSPGVVKIASVSVKDATSIKREYADIALSNAVHASIVPDTPS